MHGFIVPMLCAFVVASCTSNRETASRSPEEAKSVSIESILRKVESTVPELELIDIHTGPQLPSSVWHGNDNGEAVFVSRGQAKSRFSEVPSPIHHTKIPQMNLVIDVAEYSDAKAADDAIQRSLFLRPAAFAKRQISKAEESYSCNELPVIYQCDKYVIEIDTFSENVRPLVQKTFAYIVSALKNDAGQIYTLLKSKATYPIPAGKP